MLKQVLYNMVLPSSFFVIQCVSFKNRTTIYWSVGVVYFSCILCQHASPVNYNVECYICLKFSMLIVSKLPCWCQYSAQSAASLTGSMCRFLWHLAVRLQITKQINTPRLPAVTKTQKYDLSFDHSVYITVHVFYNFFVQS